MPLEEEIKIPSTYSKDIDSCSSATEYLAGGCRVFFFGMPDLMTDLAMVNKFQF
jgi:hypothetical protein